MQGVPIARLVRWVAAGLLAAAVSCDDPLSPDSALVDRLEVNPPAVQLTVGETRVVTARVLDANGAALTNRATYWATQNAAVATVSQTGLVSSVAAGTTQIAVSAGGKSAVVPVTVTARPVSQVRLDPATATVQVGATVALLADPVDATGAAVTGRPVIWSTSATTVATVTSTGVVTGIAAGSASITATVDGVNGTAAVTVTPVPVASVTVSPSSGSITVGQTLQLGAATASSTGQTLSGRVVTWTSSLSAVAPVSSTGLVVAISAGTATITATSEGRSGTAQIAVTAVPVASIRVTPATATVALGQTAQLAAQALDASGNSLNRSITWSSDQPSIATVSQTGLVTSVNAGVARISASVGAVAGAASVTVTPVPVATLTISPSGATVLVGDTQQLTATARDANGDALPGRVVTWISGAPSVATVSQAGLVAAVGPGSAVIFAASEGVATSVTITVTTVGVAAVRVTPGTGTIQQGTFLQLVATALDANNNVLPGKAVAWASSNEAIATVSSTGRVLGIAPGQFTIIATIDRVPGTGTYAITPVPVASITLVPNAVTIAPNATVTLVPNLVGSNGLPLSPIGRTIIWSSSNVGIATVSGGGVVTGVGQGSATITATTEGVSATSAITVSAVPIATITVTPNPASVQEGSAVTLTATARDASNNVLTGRTFTWVDNSPGVTVSASGVVTAIVSAGGQSATITASAPGGGPGGSTPSASAVVNVSFAPVASAVITPPVASLSVGSNLTLSLALQNAAGQSLPLGGRTITWTSLDAAFATVSSGGAVTGVASGTARIEVSALSPGQASAAKDTAVITVQNVAPVASMVLAVSPDSTILPGTPLTGTVTVRDAANNLLSGRTVTLVSSATGIATVTPSSGITGASGQVTGVTVTGVGAGNATITATSEGVSQSFVARILNPVNTVSVTSTPDSVIGTSAPIQAVATLRDASNAILSGRPITWSPSGNSAVATVSASGLITVTGALGSALVSASSEGKTGSFSFRVLPPVASVSLTTPGDSVIVTGTLGATAVLRDAANAVLTGRPIAWLSSNTLVATVSAAGVVSGVSAGPATITASAEGQSASVPVRVLAAITAIALTPATDSIMGMGTLALTATATTTGAVPVPGRPLTVTSSNPAIATAAPASGVTTGAGQVSLTITFVSSGTTTLTVSGGGQTATRSLKMLAPVATVSLTSPGDSVIGTATLQATATLRDAASNTLTGRPITWATSNAAVATVSATGLITAVTPGTVNITATSEGQTSPSLVIRILASVSTVTATAADSSVFVTQTKQATAVLRDASNNVLTGRAVTWSSSNAAVATVSGSGLITAVAPGSATITALVPAEGVSGTLPFTVSLVPVATVTVSPATASLKVNGTPSTQAFTTTLLDSAGGVLTGRTVTWSSSNSSKLSINPTTGVATALDSGSVTVIASTTPGTPSSPITGSASVTLTLVPVGAVTASPMSVQAGMTSSLTASVVDINAIAATGRACSAVSSDVTRAAFPSPSALTNASGVVTFTVSGVAAGTATATVTCEGKTGTATITVTP